MEVPIEPHTKSPAPCPGCGSPPAALDVNDICPGCESYLYNCGKIALPVYGAAARIVQLHSPTWTRIPPSQVKKKGSEQELRVASTKRATDTETVVCPEQSGASTKSAERGGAVGVSVNVADAEAAREEPTDRQRLILETMLEHEITSERRRKSRSSIVHLINRTHNLDRYNRDFAALVKRGYLQSLEGPHGGMWMTSKGKDVVTRL
jgi:hypothetical protein